LSELNWNLGSYVERAMYQKSRGSAQLAKL